MLKHNVNQNGLARIVPLASAGIQATGRGVPKKRRTRHNNTWSTIPVLVNVWHVHLLK